MEFNIFNFEQNILDCWNVTKDIDTLFEEICEGNPTKDDISNVLLGLMTLYNMKFNKQFNEFELLCKEYQRLRSNKIELSEEPDAWMDQYGNLYTNEAHSLMINRNGYTPLYRRK